MRARALAALTGLLARTWRWDVRGARQVAQVRAAGEPLILAPWHAALVPLVWRHRFEGYTLLVSAHDDGGLLAGVARYWGYGLVRGSSTRGGTQAYRGLLRTLRHGGAVGMTPDGPRGPVGRVKPGIVAAARRAGATIIPVAAHASRAWRLGSWDRMLVPHPGAAVRVVYGRPVRVAPGDPLEAGRAALERQLHAVTRQAAA